MRWILVDMWIWSVVIPLVGGVGVYLARDYRAGWAIGLATQVLWLMFGLTTGMLGFAVSALWYGPILYRNWRTFRPPIHHRAGCSGCGC